LSAAELIFAKKIQKNLKKKKKIIDNIYINKGIYTYIPNPDPDIPIPTSRSRYPDPDRYLVDAAAPWSIPGTKRAESEQLFGLLPGRQKKI